MPFICYNTALPAVLNIVAGGGGEKLKVQTPHRSSTDAGSDCDKKIKKRQGVSFIRAQSNNLLNFLLYIFVN